MEPIEFLPIETSTNTSEHKPELPLPQGDPKEFKLEEKDPEHATKEQQMREKIIETSMMMALQTMQHQAQRALQKQKEMTREAYRQ